MVYDRINTFGGAERVLLALHKIFPKAPLFTSVYHKKNASWAKAFQVKTSFLQHIPLARRYHQFFAPLMPFAFRSFQFDAYDLVISITSESAKNIQVRGDTKHICLCLTPTRYLWSGYDEYFSNIFLKTVSFPLVALLRAFDKQAAKKPHAYIAISREVQKRIKKYYGRESEVIYPPVTLGNRQKFNKDKTPKTKDYFLVVSRLSRFTNYKRIDLAVKAATKLDIPLLVIGKGNASHMKKYAGPTVQFLQHVSDKQLQTFYQNAKALIFPGFEDFGLVMVEAQAAGIPVIAFGKGGAMEIIQKGTTGIFFSRQTESSLVNILKSFKESRYNSRASQENAKRFSFSQFEKLLKAYILKTL